VGLKLRTLFALCLFSSVTFLHAAPTLRVVTAAVGPIPVPTGGTAPPQTVEAFNAGDGSLSLTATVSSSASWLTATVGSSRTCTQTTLAASCIPLQFTLNTSTLAAGTYTGVVTLTAGSTTIDAPQTITVTVRVGAVDVYVAPGKTVDLPVTFGHLVTPSVNTQDGNRWLSLALQGSGSFRFIFPYTVHIAPVDGMGTGNYTGNIITSGSSVSTENVNIPVTMHLTTQPIAQAVPTAINLRLAQGAPPLVYPFDPSVGLINTGQGTLTTGNIAVSGGSWIKVDPAVPSFISIDPTGLSPGNNTGSVTIDSNAVNGQQKIPVNLEIVAKGNPLIYYQGVLDNVTSVPGDAVSQGDVSIVKGEQLSFSPYTPAPSYPLTTTLGGTTVLVNGVAAPLYYTSYAQVAFQMPYETAAGTAQVQVKRDDGTISNTVTVKVVAHAPRLLAVFNQNGSVNLPDGSTPTHRGEVIVIYAFGLGPTNPVAVSGAPAPGDPLAQVSDPLFVSFGDSLFGANVRPAFAGLTPTFAGVYQINVVVPDAVPNGPVNLSVGYSETRSNAITIYVQ